MRGRGPRSCGHIPRYGGLDDLGLDRGRGHVDPSGEPLADLWACAALTSLNAVKADPADPGRGGEHGDGLAVLLAEGPECEPVDYHGHVSQRNLTLPNCQAAPARMLVYVAVPGHNVAMAGVDPHAGRIAADKIRAAQQRHVPLLTVHEGARQAGITDDGWSKVIRTGRGREGTFIAMARVAGVEPEVREALGLPPLDANVIPLPVPAESAEDAAL